MPSLKNILTHGTIVLCPMLTVLIVNEASVSACMCGRVAAILLGSIKVPYEEIKQRILRLDEEHLTPEMLEQLIKYMPEPEQLSALAELKAEYDSLAESEQFSVVVSTCVRPKYIDPYTLVRLYKYKVTCTRCTCIVQRCVCAWADVEHEASGAAPELDGLQDALQRERDGHQARRGGQHGGAGGG